MPLVFAISPSSLTFGISTSPTIFHPNKATLRSNIFLLFHDNLMIKCIRFLQNYNIQNALSKIKTVFLRSKKQLIIKKTSYETKNMRNKLNAFREKMFKPERLMNALFSDKSFVEKEIKPAQMMGDLFNIAEDMQCQPELNLSFDDLFTKDELFDIWQNDNASWCYGNGFFKSSTPRYKAHYNLLRNILDTADKAIKDGKPAVTLRFGHGNINGRRL